MRVLLLLLLAAVSLAAGARLHKQGSAYRRQSRLLPAKQPVQQAQQTEQEQQWSSQVWGVKLPETLGWVSDGGSIPGSLALVGVLSLVAIAASMLERTKRFIGSLSVPTRTKFGLLGVDVDLGPARGPRAMALARL
eukprot:gnl/TRDRNA2_/TRDRNA2_44168_c0_seq1.p1 gnl/TRDRNA2_/TRDRNA2_44168_c0~~gnl/TRDRNA2_/TRDRNA2_44168_c0_seq1.p1  ORF type:complete len:136 (+),score=28.10 gnl/TRDRNA2_/TRDRNA2_44168_c0_seq1:131-538(+)